AYNVPRGLVLKGRLDLDALQQSFNALVSRHEILRTSFPSQAGTPVQAIADDFVVALPLIDLHNLPEAERLRESELLTRSEWQRPFDLANGPLLRVLLLRLGTEEHILLVSSHHIVNDGWSQGLLLRELAYFYGCFKSGNSPGLTPIAVQYADYAQWQHGA